MLQFASELHKLFISNAGGHGSISPEGVWNEAKKKLEVQCTLKNESVTIQHWLNHLDGVESIGLAPLLEDDTVYWGAIDIDEYNNNLDLVSNSIWANNLPLVPCRSKSGKLHLYAFFSTPQDPREVRDMLKWVAVALGCSDKVEVFPKQEKVSRLKFPSWINMPYFNGARRMVGERGEEVSLEEFIDQAKKVRNSLTVFKSHFEQFQVGDFSETVNLMEGPMCVVTPLLLRYIPQGLRNHTMFAMGVYIKLLRQDQGFDVSEFVHSANSIMEDPLTDTEIERTVIASHSKASPFYSCANLKEGFCNEGLCRRAVCGKNTKSSSNITYGQLTQVLTDPPYYLWEIEGVHILFSSEKEILGQQKVRELCARYLRKVPEHAPEKQWQVILDKAFGSIAVRETTGLDEDFGDGARLMRGISRYLHHSRRADDEDQVLSMKRVYHVKEEHKILFLGEGLWEYLTNIEKVTFNPSDLVIRLKAKGGTPQKREDGYSLWSLPEDAFRESLSLLAPVKDPTQEILALQDTESEIDIKTFKDF